MKKFRADNKPIRVLIHTCLWKYHKEAPCLYLEQAKMSCFSFSLFSSTKLDKRAEQVLPREEGWHQWEGRGNGEGR
jgi:hypothetical protein